MYLAFWLYEGEEKISFKYFLGIDIGTSGCKCTVINSLGEIVGNCLNEYKTYSPNQLWVEQEPTDWYESFKISLDRICNENDIRASEISAIGVTGQMIGITPTDKSENVLRRAILWSDQRSTEEVNWLKENFEDEIFSITYNPINQAYTLPKILWLKKHEPSVWKKTYKVLLPKDFIKLKLTGTWTTDYTDAAGTLLFDPIKLRWSSVLAKIAEIPLDKLPSVYPSTKIIGGVTRECSKETNLSEKTPVVAGASDTAADCLGGGLTESGQCLIRMGSAGPIVFVTDKPLRDPNRKCSFYPYVFPNRWTILTNIQQFGTAERWFRDVFCIEEVIKAKNKNIPAYKLIDDLAKDAPIGSDGLIFHPYLLGEKAPYWDSSLRGSFVGISLNHNKEHFARAVLEGVAYAIRDAITLLRNIGFESSEFILVGGGSKSSLWCQILCDVLGINAKISMGDTSLGAAILSFNNIVDVVTCAKTKLNVYFDRNAHEKYNNLFKIYKAIHDSLEPIYKSYAFSSFDSTKYM